MIRSLCSILLLESPCKYKYYAIVPLINSIHSFLFLANKHFDSSCFKHNTLLFLFFSFFVSTVTMKSNRLYEVTGSPGLNYSAGKLERAAQFGLNYENEESFEGNQSFPRALHTHHHHHSKKPDPLHVPDFSKMKGRNKHF